MKTAFKTAAAVAALTLAATAAAWAEPVWPTRPVTMIVPFPPGGPTDLVARVLAKQLTLQTGQGFIVENKGGANGNIGMQFAAAAKNDGYTVLYNTSSISLSPNLYRSLSFDPQRDFDPVSSTAVIPLVLLVHPTVPVNDVGGFIAYMRAHPDKLSYASAGAGNVTHLAAVMFMRKTGLTAVHVPYRGSSPAMTDLAGGQVQFTMNTLNDSLPFIKDGRVKALAVSSQARSDRLPDVPTLAETVLPGFEVGAWQGVVVPKGTPPAIVAELNRQIARALQSEEMRKQLALQGAQALGSSPQAYGDYIRSETERWGEVIKAAGVKLE